MAKKCTLLRDVKLLCVRPLPFVLVAGRLIPFVMIYGIYVIFNGHLSPGGGFSGGTILGAGLVLCSLAHGRKKVREFFTFKTFKVLFAAALAFYTLLKAYAFIMGAIGGTAGIPLGTPGNIFSAGMILPLSISIGIVVACTIYCFFSLFLEGEV